MKLAILNVVGTPAAFEAEHKRFDTLLADWVGRSIPEAEVEILAISDGAALPQINAYDGYVVSGSELGVYDCASWMAPLRDFLLQLRTAQRPVFGVCFGHQIMADVFGGKAEKVGPSRVGVAQIEQDGAVYNAYVWHKDQVTQVPPRARVTASAPYCPVAALEYDFPALSVQFHPEFVTPHLVAFLDYSAGGYLDAPTARTALEEVGDAPVSDQVYSDELRSFFRSNLAQHGVEQDAGR